jgi:NADPH:quinone reductase-like Zn-dependent oxidoreductase
VRAIVRNRFGMPDVLEIADIDKPQPADDGVVVRVRAVAVNPADWYEMSGTPWIARPSTGFRKPKTIRLGVDFAGTVEAVGKDVTEFKQGDEVFGGRSGAFAEYVPVRIAVVPKPAGITLEEAAGVPVAGVTALQGLRDKGQIQAGQKVLINGASGGVGTFAVQIAKALGAEVTGVCSTRNVEIVRSLGADHVVDYTREDFTRSDKRYDLMLDVAGGRSWRACTRVLTPEATVVIAGAQGGNRMFGPLGHVLRMKVASSRSSRKVMFFVSDMVKADLVVLAELIAAGKVKPVVDRTYPFGDIADAMRYLHEGHAQGKIVITL